MKTSLLGVKPIYEVKNMNENYVEAAFGRIVSHTNFFLNGIDEVRLCMNSGFHEILGTETIKSALSLMRKHNVNVLPVVNNVEQLIGLIYKDYIVKLISERRTQKGLQTIMEFAQSVTIEKILDTTNFWPIFSDTLIREAASLLVSEQLDCLPVIDMDENILGLVTKTDIIEYLQFLDDDVVVL